MEVSRFVAMVLAIMLLIVLFFVGIQPIKSVIDSFKSIGETEDTRVTELKNACNKEYKEGCALDVAKALVETSGSSFEAQSWLRTEIKNTDNKKLLTELLTFAHTQLYPASQDWKGALETYTLLKGKLDSSSLQKPLLQAETFDKLSDAKSIYEQFKSPQGASIYTQERNAMFLSLQAAVRLYSKNKELIGNRDIGNCIDVHATVKDLAYKNTGIESVSASCPYLSRESLAVGCYLSQDPETKLTTQCTSCTKYSLESLDSRIDICSGYKEQSSCEADPCNKGDCVWDGAFTGCKSGFEVFGQTNAWDAS